MIVSLTRSEYERCTLIFVVDSATFKDAHRSVAQLTIGDPKEITIGQLEAVISPEVCWVFDFSLTPRMCR